MHGLGLSSILQKLLPFEHHGFWSPLPCAKYYCFFCPVFPLLRPSYGWGWGRCMYFWISKPFSLAIENKLLDDVPVGILLLYLSLPLHLFLSLLQQLCQPIFLSFIAFLSVLCCCSRSVACRNFNPTGPLFSLLIDLARAKSKALLILIFIVYSNKILHNARETVKTTRTVKNNNSRWL